MDEEAIIVHVGGKMSSEEKIEETATLPDRAESPEAVEKSEPPEPEEGTSELIAFVDAKEEDSDSSTESTEGDPVQKIFAKLKSLSKEVKGLRKSMKKMKKKNKKLKKKMKKK